MPSEQSPRRVYEQYLKGAATFDDVALDKRVTFPRSFADRTAYFVQVPAMAGLEIIDADDILIEP